MKPRSSAGGLRAALLASVAVHAALVSWLFNRPAPPAPAPSTRLELRSFEVVRPLVEAPPPPEKPKPVEPKRTTPTTLRASTTPTGLVAAREAAPAEAPTDVPREVEPRRVSLFPPSLEPAFDALRAEPPRGHTLRPDDPSLSPAAVAAREKALVTARVTGWAEDELAEARAQRGLPHPYFTEVRDAARAGLAKLAAARDLKPAEGAAMRAFAARYSASASNYAKTGNPGLGPTGQAPRLSEKLTQPEQAAMRALAQATETIQDLSQSAPLLSLTLDVRQPQDGGTTLVVLEASTDHAFDAFVLESWELATRAAGPPPPDAFRSSVLRSIWAVEGWPKSSLGKTADLMPDVMGLPIAKVATTDAYEFRAKLLRVY